MIPPHKPPDSDSEAESRESRVDSALADCLDTAERYAEELVERICRSHPEQADDVRRRMDALRAGGLERACGPDALVWEDETRVDDEARAYEPIGQYQPVEELGRGGQAVVYLAEDLRLHRKVALKVLKGLGPLSEKSLRRFRREAEVASGLDGTGICAVYDTGVADGIPFIAMRHVEGRTLAQMIAATRQTVCLRPLDFVGSDRPGTPG